jgi:hypothetical protein
MKKIFLKSIILVFSSCFLANGQALKKKTSKQINWLSPGKEFHSENSFTSYLKFEGAAYGEKYLPLLTEKIKINPSSNQVSAQITDAEYAPLEEVFLIEPFKDKIKSEIEITANVAFERKVPYAIISFIPLRKNPLTGAYEKLISFNISLVERNDGSRAKAAPVNTTTSVLSSGKWFKIGIAKDGVYKMDFSFLKSLGIIMSTLDPRNIRVYGSGGGMLPFANNIPRNDDLVENAIYISGENDGHFDANDFVLFYGKGQMKWNFNSGDGLFHHQDNYYSDTTYYFINTDLGVGRRINPQSSSTLPATHFVNTFNDYVLHEVDLINCVKSGKEWFGESFDPLNTARDFQVEFPNVVTSNQVCLRSDALARQIQTIPPSTNSVFNSYVNNQLVLTQSLPQLSDLYYGPCATQQVGNACFNVSSSQLTVRLVFVPGTSTAQGWLNYFELNAMRNLTLHNSQMGFRNAPCVGTGNVTEFTVSGVSSSAVVWDVTDPVNVFRQEGTLNSGSYAFRVPTDVLREYVCFNGQSFFTPRIVGEVQNQNLHSIMSADLTIVTAPEFITEAERLAEHHRDHDQMTVAVVTTQQVYNEFSSGSQDVTAIRDFVRMLYNRSTNPATLPKYLCLFGDASYDNKHRLYGNTNFIVSYHSDNSIDPTSTYIADDYFGFLDSTEGYWADNDVNQLLDVGIGRIPVKSLTEATAMVDKIINYAKNGIQSGNAIDCNSAITGFGEWRNIVTFVADDEDGNTHFNQAEQLAAKVDTAYPWYNIDKIYLDAYQQVSTPGGERYPTAQDAFAQRVQRGTLFLTYIGHGGEVGLAHERVLSVEDIESWTNYNRLAGFLTATCEFTRVDDPERTSAGELVFLNSKGGGIALFTTTRLAFSGSNFNLCKKFYDYLYEYINGSVPTLGDISMLTKNSVHDYHVKNFMLIGDPALKLAYPRWNVVTTEINNTPVSTTPDTMKALTRITVSGEIRDDNGQLMSGFNGVLTTSVYDKEASYLTLANNTGSSFVDTFQLRNKILFKGKATVTNGRFTFDFVMPKDISFQYGYGKISYYAHNGVTDAKGYNDNVIIGGFGSDSTVTDDQRGPEIKLYMNDDKFVHGGITNATPNVYAVIADESGINTAGNGIGHDITITIDNDKLYTANDYFESDLDSYQKGKLNFPLNSLSEGKHTLRLKVWDVFNNSSESSLEFYVSASKEITLNHVYNYPNPFTTRTSFMFEHNRACVPMNVQVQIFTVTGKLVKTISKNMVCDGFRYDELEWDGRDDYGDKIGRGVYMYRLRVQTADGFTADKLEKLVIL